ncbi:testis-specific protein TEX28 [Prionailurus iriomotensis]
MGSWPGTYRIVSAPRPLPLRAAETGEGQSGGEHRGLPQAGVQSRPAPRPPHLAGLREGEPVRLCHHCPDRVKGKAESSPRHCRRPSEKAPSSESPRPGGKDCLSTDLSDIVRHLPLASHFPALWLGKSWGTKRVAQQRNLLSRLMKEDLREVRELHLSLQVSYPSLKESRLMGLQVSLASLQEQKCRQASVEEQVNEHVQGYPDDICHLEQILARAEEKMAYLSYEGAKEIWSSGPHTCAALVLIGLGALAWQKRRAVSATDRQAWVPSRWRRRSEEPEPLAGGP